MQKTAIIVAAGRGQRFNNALPKQFIPLAGKPLLFYSIEAFYQYDNTIQQIICLPEDFFDYWQQLVQRYKFSIPHQIVAGGDERFDSVKNALKEVAVCEDTNADKNHWVAIHDAARPFIRDRFLHCLFNFAMQYGNAIPALPLSDSLRHYTDNGWKSVERTDYRIIQTPQIFKATEIIKAYRQPFQKIFTDDAAVMETATFPIFLTDGDEKAFKITRQEDFRRAERILSWHDYRL